MENEIECNAGWLLFIVRARRHQLERHRLSHARHAHGRPSHHISGGSYPNEALRQRVRERLADGRLLRASGVSVFRRGSGRPCNVRAGHPEERQ